MYFESVFIKSNNFYMNIYNINLSIKFMKIHWNLEIVLRKISPILSLPARCRSKHRRLSKQVGGETKPARSLTALLRSSSTLGAANQVSWVGPDLKGCNEYQGGQFLGNTRLRYKPNSGKLRTISRFQCSLFLASKVDRPLKGGVRVCNFEKINFFVLSCS